VAYTAAGLPLTGAGDATANVGVDRIAGTDYQMVKMMDGSEGSTIVFMARETTPGSTDAGLVVRPIGSTAHLQGIAGSVTVANPSTAVNISGLVDVTGSIVGVVNPTTAVSLSSVHTVTVGNPTTAVNVSSGVVLGAGSSANVLGAVAQAAGSTSVAPWYVISSAGGGGSTAVDLSSGGSTRLVGMVAQGSPAGTSADAWWVRSVTTGTAGGGSTTVDAQQGPASSDNYWFVNGLEFTSANIARTSVATSVNAAVIAANANRKGMIIANGSTAQMVGLGLSTNALTTARANVNIYLQANSQLRFGLMGDLPCWCGPIRGINLTSTAVTGGVIVTEFT